MSPSLANDESTPLTRSIHFTQQCVQQLTCWDTLRTFSSMSNRLDVFPYRNLYFSSSAENLSFCWSTTLKNTQQSNHSNTSAAPGKRRGGFSQFLWTYQPRAPQTTSDAKHKTLPASQQHFLGPASLPPTGVFALGASSLPLDEAPDASSLGFWAFFLCFTSVGIFPQPAGREDVLTGKTIQKGGTRRAIRWVTDLQQRRRLKKTSSLGWTKCDKRCYGVVESWSRVELAVVSPSPKWCCVQRRSGKGKTLRMSTRLKGSLHLCRTYIFLKCDIESYFDLSN